MPGLSLLADQCVYAPTITLLRSEGFSVFTAKELGLQEAADRKIFDAAIERRIALLTLDREFGNILLYPPINSHGIIVISAKLATLPLTHSHLLEYLRRGPSLDGKLVVVSPAGVRVHS